jgi:hypothetical protein
MRPVMLAFVFSLVSSSYLQAGTLVERYPWLVTKAWYQLCGGNRFLPFDPQFSCCCRTPSTGKHCVRRGTGIALDCIQICNTALCM